MAPAAKGKLPWATDGSVLAVGVVANIILMCVGWLIAIFVDCSPPRPLVVADAWFWVVATPAYAARALGRADLFELLFGLNPLIYGLQWWLIWRVVKAWRTRTAD